MLGFDLRLDLKDALGGKFDYCIFLPLTRKPRSD